MTSLKNVHGQKPLQPQAFATKTTLHSTVHGFGCTPPKHQQKIEMCISYITHIDKRIPLPKFTPRWRIAPVYH